jgi:hypothetical protein
MWYISKLVFNINVAGNNAAQFDEQLRLIAASSAEEAFFKARALGRNEEASFVNSNEKKISWKFIDVTDVSPIDQLNDGAELYSSTHETDEADSYIKFVRHKAMVIQSENLVFA